MFNYLRKFIRRLTLAIPLMLSLNGMAQATNIAIHYVHQQPPVRALLSTLVKPAQDSGLAGVRLAIKDANTTGRFINQHFELTQFDSADSKLVIENIISQYQLGNQLFVVDVDTVTLIAINNWAQDKPVLIFNIANAADQLRTGQCASSMLHTIPSDAMRADALAQWLLYRRFTKVLIVQGQYPEDTALVDAFTRSAKRLGIKIIDHKIWAFDSDLRRSASQEMPLFTQTSSDYDVVFVADRAKDFAQYLPFNTYLPRPVIGSAGLEPLAWHWSIEQWGAAQLQNRFQRLASIAQAAQDSAKQTEAKQAAPLTANRIIDYLRSDQLHLAAYLGRKLSFRQWNGQLRMPIALVHPAALISQSPQPGFLHPKNELDTLGFDQVGSGCSINQG
ncbi:MAG: ABC transporter substrate-binding protein [Gammaproteobacteria bacterium]|nr:ABC transporter substrate-binding protein [Gammaproteobacteria bacterium]